MARLAVLGAICGLVGACAATQPGLHVIAGTQPVSALRHHGDHFDCSAAYGHFYRSARLIHAGSVLVTGSLYFRATWTPGGWLPVAKIIVRGDDHTKQRAGISMIESPGKSFTVVDVEYYSRGDGVQQTWLDHLAPRLGDDVNFALRLDKNRLEVRAGPSRSWTSVPLSFTPHDVELACSSAEVIFHDLNVTAPAPP